MINSAKAKNTCDSVTALFVGGFMFYGRKNASGLLVIITNYRDIIR